jgi:hypothetical protein
MTRALVAVIAVVAVAATAHGAKSDWTGSQACGTCHQAQLAAWKLTPHATTAKRFTARPEGKCLACHSTGEAPAGPVIAVEVGCEACHGAGAGYAEDDLMRNLPVSRALGLEDLAQGKSRAPKEGSATGGELRSPRAAVCARCHSRVTRAKPFDPDAPVHQVKKP